MSEALECPFCGVALDHNKTGWMHPENDCILSWYQFGDFYLPDWNTRAPDPRIAAARALAAACEPAVTMADAYHPDVSWQFKLAATDDVICITVGDLRRIRDARAALLEALEAGDA